MVKYPVRFLPLLIDDTITDRDYLYHLSKDVITVDLKGERPIWPLSAYGPGKDAPRQLIDGDMSPEELRSQFYKARASGNEAAGVCIHSYCTWMCVC